MALEERRFRVKQIILELLLFLMSSCEDRQTYDASSIICLAGCAFLRDDDPDRRISAGPRSSTMKKTSGIKVKSRVRSGRGKWPY